MPHFLIEQKDIKNDYIELFESDNFFHITKALRAKTGEKIKFIDKNQTVYYCTIEKITKNNLIAKIDTKAKSKRMLKYNICLIQSILANDAQNLAIANAVQSGVKEIYPVISDNVCVPKNSLKDKISKWNKIAYENFKQCERADEAKINEIMPLKEALKYFKKENTLIFAEKYENKTLNNFISDIDKSSKIAIVIGAEGGFSEDEFQYFIKNNYKLITLGSMIYKAPNAITASVSNVISRVEND